MTTQSKSGDVELYVYDYLYYIKPACIIQDLQLTEDKSKDGEISDSFHLSGELVLLGSEKVPQGACFWSHF